MGIDGKERKLDFGLDEALKEVREMIAAGQTATKVYDQLAKTLNIKGELKIETADSQKRVDKLEKSINELLNKSGSKAQKVNLFQSSEKSMSEIHRIWQKINKDAAKGDRLPSELIGTTKQTNEHGLNLLKQVNAREALGYDMSQVDPNIMRYVNRMRKETEGKSSWVYTVNNLKEIFSVMNEIRGMLPEGTEFSGFLPPKKAPYKYVDPSAEIIEALNEADDQDKKRIRIKEEPDKPKESKKKEDAKKTQKKQKSQKAEEEPSEEKTKKEKTPEEIAEDERRKEEIRKRQEGARKQAAQKREEEERKKAQRQAEAEEIKRKAAEERRQKEESVRRAEEELAKKRQEQREEEQRKEQEKQQREEEKNKKDDFIKESQKRQDEKNKQDAEKKERQKQSSSQQQSPKQPKQPPFIEPLVLSPQEREQVIDAFTTAKIKDQYEGQFEQMGEIKDVTKAVKNVDGKRVPVYTVTDGNTSITGTATRGKNGELYDFKFTKSSSKKGQTKINTEEAAKKAASDKENEEQRKEAINQQVEDLAKDRENFYKDYISAKESHRKARREVGSDSEAAKEAKEQRQEALNNFREKDRELNNLQYYGTDDEQSAAKKQNRAFQKKRTDIDAAYERRRNKDNVQRTLKMEKEDKKEQDRYIKQSAENAKRVEDKVAKEMAKQQMADYKQQEKLRGKEIKSAEKDDEKRQIQDINSLLAQQKEQYQSLSQAKEQLANPTLGQQERDNIQKTVDARQKELETTQQQIDLYRKSNIDFKKDKEGNLVESGVKNKNVENALTKGSSDFEAFKKKTDDDSKVRQDQYNQAIDTYNKQAEQAKKELVQAELAASEVSKDDKVLQDAANFVQKLNDPNNYNLNAKNANSVTNQIKKETANIKSAIQERQKVLTAPENFKDMQKAFGEEDVVKGLSNFGETLGIGTLQKTNISSTGSGTITFIDDLGNTVETTTVKVKDLAQTLESIRSGEYAKTYAELGDVISRSSRDKTEAELKRERKALEQDKEPEAVEKFKKEKKNLDTINRFADAQKRIQEKGIVSSDDLSVAQDLIKQFSDVGVSAETAGDKIKLVGDHSNEAMESINQNVKKSLTDTYQKKYDKMLSKSDNKMPEYMNMVEDYETLLSKLKSPDFDFNLFDADDVAQLHEIIAGLDIIEKKSTSTNLAKASQSSLSKLNSNIQKFRTDYSKALGDDDFRFRFEQIEEGFNTAKSVADVNKLSTALNNLKAEANKAGLAGKSFGDLWYQRMRSLGAYLTSFVSFYEIWDVIKQGISTVTELNTALTEMRKVSDESVASLKGYQFESFDIADKIGTNALQIQNSTADWMRLGESLNEASHSAETSNILLNVSEFQSIDEATTSLVSMSQAYKDIDKMDIVDKLNNIGNNYSISTDQIATALQNSAASLVTAHNDIDESIALVTAGNAITQDASKTGAGLRTIALRIQGTEEAKEELASLGEDTDDYVVATKSKIDQQVKDFTAVASNGFKGISVLDENGNYRSTYQILQDIADVYDEIQQTDKEYGTNHEQGLLELLAGKTRSNIAASILQNGDMLRSVYESSQNSQGSALEENEKYLDSIEGKTQQLQNRLQELAFTSIDSEMFKGAIDGATTLIELINTLVSSIGSLPALASGIFGGVLARDGYRISGNKSIGNLFDFFTKKNYTQNLNQSSFFSAMADTDFSTEGVREVLETSGNDGNLISWIMSKGGSENQDLDKGIEGLNAELEQYSTNTEKAQVASKNFNEEMANTHGVTGFSSALKSLGGLLTTVASSMVTMGLSMAAMWVVSKGIEWVNDYIHQEENAVKAGEEAQQNINESVSAYEELNSSLQTLGQTYSDNDTKISSSSDAISSLAEKYTELKEGVNSVTNENISLSDSDYQAYLDISNQLAQAMPSLQSGTDNAGNAILNLGNNASDAKDKLQELYNVQQQITHGDISQNLQDVYKGMVTEITGSKNGIDKQISDLRKKNQDILKNQSITDTKLKDSKWFQTSLNFGQENNKQLVNRFKEIIGNAYEEVNPNDFMGFGARAAKSNSLFYDGAYNQVKVDTNKLLRYLENNKEIYKKAQDQINAEIAKFVEKNNTEVANNNNQIAALTTQREAQWKEIVPTVQSFLKTESNFSGLDKTLQEGILNNLGNMNVDSVMNKVRDSYGGDLEFYLYGEFISPLQKTSEEQQKALSDLLTLDTSKLNFNQYSQSVSDALQKAFPNEEKLQNEWRSKLGIDSMLQQYSNQIKALSTRVSGLAREDLLQLSQEELNLAVKMTLEDGPFNGTLAELKTKIEEFKQTAQEPVPVTIQEFIKQEDSGFQKIQKASETENAGATYDSFVQNLKTAKELVESGDIGTDDFKAIAEMFSPSGSDDYANWVENLPNIEKYFTEGNEGVTNFMEKLEELNYATFDEDGNFSFMTEKAHDLETIADEMGISYEAFLSLWGKLEDKGVNVDFFATAEEGKEKLVTLNGEILQAQMELNEAEVKYGKDSQVYKSKEEALESLRDRYKDLQEAVENYDESGAEKKKQKQQDKINKKNKELVEDSIKNFNKGDKYNEAFDPEKYRTDEDYKKRMDAYRDQLIKAGKEYGFDKMGQTITGTMSKDVEKSNKEQLGVLFKDIQDGVTRSQTGTWLNALNDYAKNQGKTLEGFLKENGYSSEDYTSLKDYIDNNGFFLEGITDPITNAVTNATDLFTAGMQTAAQEFRDTVLGKEPEGKQKEKKEKETQERDSKVRKEQEKEQKRKKEKEIQDRDSRVRKEQEKKDGGEGRKKAQQKQEQEKRDIQYNQKQKYKDRKISPAIKRPVNDTPDGTFSPRKRGEGTSTDLSNLKTSAKGSVKGFVKTIDFLGKLFSGSGQSDVTIPTGTSTEPQFREKTSPVANIPVQYDKETAEESLETVNEETAESIDPVEISAKVDKVDPASVQEAIASTATSMSQGISAGVNVQPQTHPSDTTQHVTQTVDKTETEVPDATQIVHQEGQPDEQMTNPEEGTQEVAQEANPSPEIIAPPPATQVVNQTKGTTVETDKNSTDTSKIVKDTQAKVTIAGDSSKAVAAAKAAESAIKSIPTSHHTSITASASGVNNAVESVKSQLSNLHDKTVYIHVKKVGDTGGIAGGAGAKGTAYNGGGHSFAKALSGSAFASGNIDNDNFPTTWKTPVSGTSLVGELGREIVVDTNSNRWYTVGDNGAEFTKIPKNAIIFNNDQTEKLLSNGALSGVANASGTAHGGGSAGGKTLLRKSGGSGNSGSGKSSKKSKGKSSGGGNDSGSGKKSSKKGKSDKGSSKLEQYLENIFDWAEYRLKNLSAMADKYSKLADSAQVWSKQIETATQTINGVNVNYTVGGASQLYDQALHTLNEQIAGTQKSIQGYQAFYNKAVKLSGLDSATIQKIQNLTSAGQFDVQVFGGSGKSKGKNSKSSKNKKLTAIENVSKWYQKVLDTQNSIEDLILQRAELAQKKLDAVEDIYNAQASVYENTAKRDQARMEHILNATGISYGYFSSARSSVSSAMDAVNAARETYNQFSEEFNRQVAQGYLVKGTKSYNENLAKRLELETKIYEAINDAQEQVAETFENISEHYENLRERNEERLDVNEGNIDITKRNQRGYTSRSLRNLYGERNNLQYNNLQLAAEELYSQQANKQLLISSRPNDLTALKAADEAIEAAQNKWSQALVDYRQYLYDAKDENIDNIEDYFGALQDYFDSVQDAVDAGIDWKNTVGKVVTERDYKDSIDAVGKAVDNAREKYNAMFAELKDQIEKGYIVVGSQKWYESLAKINSIQNDVLKAETTRKDLYNQISQIRLDNIQAAIDSFTNLNDMLSDFADLLNDMGNKRQVLGKVDEPYLRRQMGISEQTIYGYDRQRTELLKQMDGVEKYSERWNDLNDQLQDVNSNIIQAAQNMEEFADAIREVRWDKFNKGIETIDYTKTELSDLIDILNEENFTNKNGTVTLEGLSAIALYGKQIEKNVEEVQAYRTALEKLQEEYDNNVISQDEYTETSREYMDAIRDSTSAIQDLRDAMTDLYFDALEKENDLLQENISKREDALDREKQYYDYQKTIKNDTKDIKYLQSQIAALNGVNSLSAQGKLSSLRSQLADATEQYNDDKQNHYFDLMSQGYTKMSDDANKALEDIEDAVKRSTEKQTQIIREMLNTAGNEYKNVYQRINQIINENGIVLSNNTQNTINKLRTEKTSISDIGLTFSGITAKMVAESEAITGASGIITTAINKLGMVGNKLNDIVIKASGVKTSFSDIGTEIDKIQNSFNKATDSIVTAASTALSKIKNLADEVQAQINKAQAAANAKVASATKAPATTARSAASSKASASSSSQQAQASQAQANKQSAIAFAVDYIVKNSSKFPAKAINATGDKLIMGVAKLNGNKTIRPNQVADLKNRIKAMLGVDYSSDAIFYAIQSQLKAMINGRTATGMVAYAKGSEHINRKQNAITNESGWEAIYRKSDGAILTPLNVGDKVFTNEMSENLWKLAQGNTLGTEMMSKTASPVINNVETYKPNITVSFENFMTVQGNVDKDVLGDLKDLKNEWMTDFSKHLTKEFGLLGNKRRFS